MLEAFHGLHFVDCSATAEGEGEAIALTAEAGEVGAIAARSLVAAHGSLADHDLLLVVLVDEGLKLDLQRRGGILLRQRFDQPDTGAVARIRWHQAVDIIAHIALHALGNREWQRFTEHGLTMKQGDRMLRQLDLAPEASGHVLHDRPVGRSENLAEFVTIRLQLAGVLHQKHRTGGVDDVTFVGIEGQLTGHADVVQKEHGGQGIDQAAGSGGTLDVHCVVKQFSFFQCNGGDLCVLTANIDQQAEVLIDVLDAARLEAFDMFTGIVDGTARMGVVLHQHRHPVCQLRIDVDEGFLHLVAGAARQPDLADLQGFQSLGDDVGKDLFDRIDGIAGIGVGALIEDDLTRDIADDQLRHG